MPSNTSPGPAPEGVEVRDDGTVRIAWTDHNVVLRRPTIEQWLDYLEAGEAIDQSGPIDEDTKKPRALTVREVIGLGADGPYRQLYARIMTELGGTEVTAAELPSYLIDSRLLSQLSGVWLSIPLLRSDGTMGTVKR